MKFAREAWPFVVPFLVLAAALLGLGHLRWAGAAATAALLVLLFFRDPKRSYDGPSEVVLAPADGTVTKVDLVTDAEAGGGPFRRVVTFLSVFNVHVQQAPATGLVTETIYRPGRKVAAFVEDADKVNEQCLTVIEQADGTSVAVRQIAGLLARRVVCYLESGDRIGRGEPLGLIKFGSRVDLLVPEDYEILVQKGDRVRNGLTPMARPAREPARVPPEADDGS